MITFGYTYMFGLALAGRERPFNIPRVRRLGNSIVNISSKKRRTP